MVKLIKLLDNCGVDRAAGFRVKNLKKAQLIIIDEVGYDTCFLYSHPTALLFFMYSFFKQYKIDSGNAIENGRTMSIS